MNIPKILKIGPLDYNVEQMPDLYYKGEPVFGTLNGDELAIKIDRDMPEQRKPITLWHEAIHAILIHAARNDVTDEVVSVLAFGIVDLLKDNLCLREEYG